MLQWSKMLLSLVVVAVCCQQLVHAWHTSSPRPTASFHRNMHMTLSQQKTNVWKKWILTSAVAVGFTASDLSWTGLAPSPVAHAAAVTASKKTNTAATTTTTTASSSASTTVIKTADELALENSIAKQESGKKRANDLNEEVKAANNKINAIRNDLKKLDTSLSKVTSQLRKSGIDESTKARLTEEKTDLEKTISDKRLQCKLAERSIDRNRNEIESLSRRMKSDQIFIKAKQTEIAKRKEQQAKDFLIKKKNDLQREAQQAAKNKDMVQLSLKKSQDNYKKLQTVYSNAVQDVNNNKDNEKMLIQRIETLKKDLVDSQSSLQATKKKAADLLYKAEQAEKAVKESIKEVKSKEDNFKLASNTAEKLQKSLKK